MNSSSDDDEAESAPTSVGLGPGDETTMLPPATHAASQHAWSQEEPETQPLRQSWGLTWGRAAVLLVCTGVIALAVGFGGWALVRMHESSSAPSPAASSSAAWAAPERSPWMPTTTAQLRTPTIPPKLGIGDLPGTDGLGWVSYPGARCDPGNHPAAVARTTQSVVVVCEIQPGNFYYRGVRLSDGASIELANAVRSSQGFDVTNPTDGTTYRIRPTGLTIASPSGPPSTEPMIQYGSR